MLDSPQSNAAHHEVTGFAPALRIPLVNQITGATAEVRRFQAERFVFTVEAHNSAYKVFQVFFERDGSLYVNFPYSTISHGIVSIGSVPPPFQQADVDLTVAGKVTSKQVKYAHHPNGEVHFSQTGKVSTSVKKMALPLAKASGHIFSLHVQGLHHFKEADPAKDNRTPRSKRTVLNFRRGEAAPEAFKLAGWWYEANALMHLNAGGSFGPRVTALSPDKKARPGFLIGPPKGWEMEEYALFVGYEETARLDKDRDDLLVFIGGFDAPSATNDLSRPATFLAALYPASDYDRLRQFVGSIDL